MKQSESTTIARAADNQPGVYSSNPMQLLEQKKPGVNPIQLFPQYLKTSHQSGNKTGISAANGPVQLERSAAIKCIMGVIPVSVYEAMIYYEFLSSSYRWPIMIGSFLLPWVAPYLRRMYQSTLDYMAVEPERVTQGDNKENMTPKVTTGLELSHIADLRKDAYLQEGEGNLLANRWGVSATVYVDSGVIRADKLRLINANGLNYGNGGRQGYALFTGGNHYINLVSDVAGKYIDGDGNRFREGKKAIADGNCLIDVLHIIARNEKGTPEIFKEARKYIADNISRDTVRGTLNGMITGMLAGEHQPGIGTNVLRIMNKDTAFMKVYGQELALKQEAEALKRQQKQEEKLKKKQEEKDRLKKLKENGLKGKEGAGDASSLVDDISDEGDDSEPDSDDDKEEGGEALRADGVEKAHEDGGDSGQKNIYTADIGTQLGLMKRSLGIAAPFTARHKGLIRRIDVVLDSLYIERKQYKRLLHELKQPDFVPGKKAAAAGPAVVITYETTTLEEFINSDSDILGTVDNVLTHGFGSSYGTNQTEQINNRKVKHQHVEGGTAIAFAWVDKDTLHIAGFGTKSDSAVKGSGGYKWDTKPK